MGLRTKDAPRELRPELIETVWPGDSGVDLDQSNLAEWYEQGGKAGLVESGEGWDVIKLRKLDPDEKSWIIGLMMDRENHALIPSRVFAISVVSIDGMDIRRTSVAGGIQMMSRKQMNELAAEEMEFTKEDGVTFTKTLPDVIGEHIFALTFPGK